MGGDVEVWFHGSKVVYEPWWTSGTGRLGKDTEREGGGSLESGNIKGHGTSSKQSHQYEYGVRPSYFPLSAFHYGVPPCYLRY